MGHLNRRQFSIYLQNDDKKTLFICESIVLLLLGISEEKNFIFLNDHKVMKEQHDAGTSAIE